MLYQNLHISDFVRHYSKIISSMIIEIKIMTTPILVLSHNFDHPINFAFFSKVTGISIHIKPNITKKGAIDNMNNKIFGNAVYDFIFTKSIINLNHPQQASARATLGSSQTERLSCSSRRAYIPTAVRRKLIRKSQFQLLQLAQPPTRKSFSSTPLKS